LAGPKLFIGPMSVNIVDAVIEYANEAATPLGLIPSRRQVDHSGGYVGWTTAQFAAYVRGKTSRVVLQRDHGGEGQGDQPDDGIASYSADAKHFDLIHIDPWKARKEYADGLRSTIETMQRLDRENPRLQYEVGTEEAIRPMSTEQLDQFLRDIKEVLPAELFKKIRYGVIQSGTSLRETHNTGKYDEDRLAGMVEVCRGFGLLSKEHNGDYLATELIQEKFDAGLDAINIAPEFGKIETEAAMEAMSRGEFDEFFRLCHESGRWKKWVAADFNPQENREALTRITGHYVFNHPRFREMKQRWTGFDAEAKRRLKKRIGEIVG
jgi:hypothetical protein